MAFAFLLRMRKSNVVVINARRIYRKKWVLLSNCMLLSTSLIAVRSLSSRMPNPTVYFDLTAGGTPVGRVVMEVSEEKA